MMWLICWKRLVGDAALPSDSEKKNASEVGGPGRITLLCSQYSLKRARASTKAARSRRLGSPPRAGWIAEASGERKRGRSVRCS